MAFPVVPKPGGRWPVAPKTQASGLGAAAGSAVGGVIVGLIQAYVTHKALPQADVGAIYLASTAAVAWAAAYFAPHQDRQNSLPGIPGIRPPVPPGGSPGVPSVSVPPPGNVTVKPPQANA